MNIAIVASGPSAAGLNLPPGCKIIAVNGAIDWLPRADFWFTLDMSAENERRARRPRPGVEYVEASESLLPSAIPGVRRLRRVSGRAEEPREKGTPEWWFWRWSCVAGLSEDPSAIHTGNSAFGALGFAYHLRPHKIALFGVDGTDEEKIGGGRTRELAHLPMLFASATAQLHNRRITVLNGSLCSRVSCFPKTLREVAERWITG